MQDTAAGYLYVRIDIVVPCLGCNCIRSVRVWVGRNDFKIIISYSGVRASGGKPSLIVAAPWDFWMARSNARRISLWTASSCSSSVRCRTVERQTTSPLCFSIFIVRADPTSIAGSRYLPRIILSSGYFWDAVTEHNPVIPTNFAESANIGRAPRHNGLGCLSCSHKDAVASA